MLTPEIMGALALAVLWTATLLISAAAAGDLLRLVARRTRTAGVGSPCTPGVRAVAGTVVSAGELAALSIHEVGRTRPNRRAIAFHPRRHEAAIAGGLVRTDDGALLEVPALAAAAAEVWRRPQDPPPELDFAAAHAAADKVRGYARVVRHRFTEGDRVFVAGALAAAGEGRWAVSPAPDPTRVDGAATVLISAVDPRRWYGRTIALSLVAIAGFLLSAAAATALAFTGPPFGWISTFGGVLGLAQFLAVQPLGVALRDAVTAPDRAVVHRDWVERDQGAHALGTSPSSRAE